MTKEELERLKEIQAEKKIESYIGLSRRCGKLAIGTEQTIAEVRRASGGHEYEGGAKLRNIAVIVSSGVSQRTHKQLTDKCSYYGAYCIESKLDSYDLSKLIGKSAPVSAIAVTERKLAEAIIDLVCPEE